ncbi:MAG: hypothetical protein ACM37W_23870 [Actinomycetota bacterium]
MEQQIVHLFVFNTLADWETGFAVAGINNPASQKHPGPYTNSFGTYSNSSDLFNAALFSRKPFNFTRED